MFGCFRLILSFIFFVVAAIILYAFYLFGGFDFVERQIDTFFHPPKASIQEEAKKFGDFSKLPENYELTRTVDMFGIKSVIAKDKKTDQKMALVDTGWVMNISKNDIRTNAIDNEIKKAAARFKNQPVKLEKLEVGQKGFFKALEQNIPYVKVKIITLGTINKNVEGIIGVAETPDHKNNLVISINEPGKYKQDIAETFFKNVKFNTAKD